MVDILVRGVPESVVAVLESRAAALGLSRTEFIRRQWAHEASRSGGHVETHDLNRFTETFADLADPEVMGGAWS